MKNLQYWMWLTEVVGFCSVKPKQITQLYDSIEDFYNGGEKEWRLSGLFSNNEIEKMSNTALDVGDDIIKKCVSLGYEMITIEDPSYPVCLYNIDDPPAVLYVSGMLPDIDDRLSVAIIGTRKASRYGITASYEFAYQLAKAGVTIISGGALGVDSSSHMGALAANGVTVCVLGCGINYKYLRENAKMRSNITYRGAVISEYPPDSKPMSFHFPQRNRIISALSDAILVIEAGKKSGSLITVEAALEQDINKKIFALAGPADPHFYGSNDLIKQKIATLVTEYTDIIDAFDEVYVTSELAHEALKYDDAVDAVPVKGKLPDNIFGLRANDLTEVPVHKENAGLSEEENKVYYAVKAEPVHIDDIAAEVDLPIRRVLSILTLLEMKDMIVSVEGRSYKLI